MSTYECTADDGERICPYCALTWHVEAEEYSEDEREEECPHCEMKMYATDSFTVTHHATPDCELNAAEHQWEVMTLRNGRRFVLCGECGKHMPHDDQRYEEMLANQGNSDE